MMSWFCNCNSPTEKSSLMRSSTADIVQTSDFCRTLRSITQICDWVFFSCKIVVEKKIANLRGKSRKFTPEPQNLTSCFHIPASVGRSFNHYSSHQTLRLLSAPSGSSPNLHLTRRSDGGGKLAVVSAGLGRKLELWPQNKMPPSLKTRDLKYA